MKLLITLVLLISTLALNAQINKPALSPRITINQQVALVNVTLDYGQPNKQNRKVFGSLIPYNKVWRTGANSSTKLTFDQDIKLAGHSIPKGTYGLYSIPGKSEWTIIIHKDSKLWGSGGYDKANDLIRFQVPVHHLTESVETLNIRFENFKTDGGDLTICWENTKVIIPLFVNSDHLIFKEILEKTASTNTTISGQTYFDAAQFYYHKNKDLNTAMVWFDKAIALKPTAFWYVYYKAELALELKQYDVAKETVSKSLSMAKQANNDYGYIAKCELLLHSIAKHN